MIDDAMMIAHSRDDLVRDQDGQDGMTTMTDQASEPATDDTAAPDVPPKVLTPKLLTPAAKRALAEADARRAAGLADARLQQKEFQGPSGPEPTRYGDWETKGIISDF